MSDLVNMYIVIDNMQEVTKSEYYKMRDLDRQRTVLSRPYGFVYLYGKERLIYLTQNGKFYKGELPATQNYNDLAMFDFSGIDIRAPQGVFKRKQAA